MILKKEIGNAIKIARKNAGFTQEGLAEKVNVSPTYIRYLETGRRTPSLFTLYNIAITLNMSVDKIFFQKEILDIFIIKFENKLTKCSQYELTIIDSIIDLILQILKDKKEY